jgi:hypothetical protein
MKFRRNLLSRLYRSPEPGDEGGGFAESAPPADAGVQPAAPAATPANIPTPEAPPAADKPLSLHEAMFGKPATAEETAEAAATGKTITQLRDEKGRFAGKAPEATPPVQGQQPPKKPDGQPDLTQMPEGLTEKAQQRFQALANTNKELTARVTEWEPIVQSAVSLQQTFHENGIKREQFDQAMQVVGLMNRGDLRGALKALDEQRALISLHLGEPVPGADALASHQDLRQAVDNLQITEQHALEIARARRIQQDQQRADQQQQQARQQQEREQQTQQQAEHTRTEGLKAVDELCKGLQQTDIDFARIEPMLLKEIQDGLLQGVHPSRWSALVQKTYSLIKQTAAQTRAAAPTAGVLRPSGGESPRQAPGSMHEAMWGSKA